MESILENVESNTDTLKTILVQVKTPIFKANDYTKRI